MPLKGLFLCVEKGDIIYKVYFRENESSMLISLVFVKAAN